MVSSREHLCLSDRFPARLRHGSLNPVSTAPITWLDYSQVSERLQLSPGKVRRLVQERALLARRHDGAWRIPDVFLDERGIVADVKGTATVLIDGGYDEDEALDWFLSDNDMLGTTPIDAIRQGRKTEVRRLAQTLAL